MEHEQAPVQAVARETEGDAVISSGEYNYREGYRDGVDAAVHWIAQRDVVLAGMMQRAIAAFDKEKSK